MRKGPKLNRYQRREVNAEKLKNNMGGTGVYIYENNTDGDLKLPKPTDSGLRMIGPRKRFQGDSYFMTWVGSPMNLLRLVEEVVPKKTYQEIQQEKQELLNEVNMNDKLILDQPDTITNNGKIERVVAQPNQIPLNDVTDPEQKKPDVLLTEGPLDGIEIILG
jgi:hypothetical protein